MLPVLLLTVGLVASVMLAMAVGVVFSNKELKGSCGGVGGPDCACERQGKLVGDCGKDFVAIRSSTTAGSSPRSLAVYGQGNPHRH